jgi:hypothetical protein
MAASAHIQRFSVNDEGHTEYFINVIYLGSQWALRKRFNDFVKIDQVLKSCGINIPVDLPVKTWWNKFDKNVLTQRQKELQLYINSVLRTIELDNSLVKEFLEVDENMLNIARSKHLVDNRQNYFNYRGFLIIKL